MPITQLSPKQLQKRLQENAHLRLIDVRETGEFEYGHIAGSEHLPLGRLTFFIDQFKPDDELVMICHHGMRSYRACQILDHFGFQNIYNLQGGIDAWSLECDSSVPRY